VKALALLLCVACAGCAGPGMGRALVPGTIYADVAAPLEYRAGTQRGAREVRGEACQIGLFLPGTPASVSWGDGGLREAVQQAQAQAPGASLTDVRADLRVLSVLLIFRRQCVVVTAAAPP
jgi:hypothetical protein